MHPKVGRSLPGEHVAAAVLAMPGVNLDDGSRNYGIEAALSSCSACLRFTVPQMQRHEELRAPPYSAAIRTKLGEALRERYDLREPLAPGLVELLGRLDGRVLARETAMAKLYAEVDEAVATIVRDAKSKVA
jgi:hypothetical protein